MTRLKVTAAFCVTLVLVFALALGAGSVAYAEDASAESAPAVGDRFALSDPQWGELTFSITVVAEDAETLGCVQLVDGTNYTGAELLLNGVEHDGFAYAVASVGANAFKNNVLLTSIKFGSDLTGDAMAQLPPDGHLGLSVESPAIGANAFEGCPNLTSVAFPEKVAGIGNFAFLNCTSLSSVTFPEGAKLYYSSLPSALGTPPRPGPAIGVSAFESCRTLQVIVIPAITSTRRNPDYHNHYNGPDDAYVNVPTYSGYGHISAFGGFIAPAYSWAFGESAFKNCESLEVVVFEPSGEEFGLFAYFNQDMKNPVFKGCNALSSVIYLDEQPYYADPNRALYPGGAGGSASYHNVYEKSTITPLPNLYYAVNYYATTNETDIIGDGEENSTGDDGFASGRYARTEYLRGTSTAALATSDTEELANARYADVSAYAQTGCEYDGTIPDPKQVAVEVNLDTVDSNRQWVWKLGATQSRRAGLSDSCYAYLAPADEFSAGRVGASQIATMYKLCDQNLSQGQDPVKDSPFDVARYCANAESVGDNWYYFDGSGLVLDAGETAWFTLGSSLEESFYNQIQIFAAGGSLLDPSDYEVAFARYDATSGEFVSATLGEQDGPLLMTVTPGAESGYTGTLQEWVLVKGHAGSVREGYTASSVGTQAKAVYYDGYPPVTVVSPFNGSYAVAIGLADASSALVAAGYAGLTSAPVNVRDTKDASYGFALAEKENFFSGSGLIQGPLMTFPATDYSPAEFAVAVYNIFEESRRGDLGTSKEAYPWGDTAVLITPSSVKDVAAGVAAFAYAKKAPVFYTQDNGLVSEDTLACLKQFDRVVVMGDETLFSDEAYQALEAALNPNLLTKALRSALTQQSVSPFASDAHSNPLAALGEQATSIALERIAGDAGSACSLSLKVAELLIDKELAAPSIITITDATEVADILAALNLSGHEGGLTLVSACTADSKQISAFLREYRDEVSLVRLFGRDATRMSTTSFNLYDSLCDLWNEQGYVTPQTGAGDTLVLYGLQLSIESDSSLSFTDRLWGALGLAAGTYEYGGQSYSLLEAVDALVDKPTEKPKFILTKPLITNPFLITNPPKKIPVSNPKITDPPTAGKQPGHLSISSPEVDNSGRLVSSSGSNPTGTLGVSQMAINEGQDTNALADAANRALNAQSNPGRSDASNTDEVGASQQAVTDPRVAAAIVGAAVLALAAALWFALRRRKLPTPLTNTSGPEPAGE